MDPCSGLSKIKAYGSESEDSEQNEDVRQSPIPFKKPKLHNHEREESCSCNRPQDRDRSNLPDLDPDNEVIIGRDAAQRKCSTALPSVPKNILEMFAETTVEIPKDDPSEHMGRVRSFPHIRGNWPSYIYIFYPEDAPVISEVNKLICDAAKSLMSEMESLYSIEEKHLSLSRTLPFRHHWIEPFVSNLKLASSSCESFDLYFDEFDVYTNDDQSRTFVSLKVVGSISLLKLVRKCDACLADFQLDPYYKDPSFHISCAWMLGDQRAWAKQKLIPILNKKWNESLESDPELQRYNVSSLEFKTGNKIYRFYLHKLGE